MITSLMMGDDDDLEDVFRNVIDGDGEDDEDEDEDEEDALGESKLRMDDEGDSDGGY